MRIQLPLLLWSCILVFTSARAQKAARCKFAISITVENPYYWHSYKVDCDSIRIFKGGADPIVPPDFSLKRKTTKREAIDIERSIRHIRFDTLKSRYLNYANTDHGLEYSIEIMVDGKKHSVLIHDSYVQAIRELAKTMNKGLPKEARLELKAF